MASALIVSAVREDSIAEEMEIEVGDKVLAVDGREIDDIVDFQYLTAEEEFTLTVEKLNGEIWEIEIECYPEEFLGLEVQEVGTDGLKTCHNNCIFCFVAQMPKGMRTTLYDKDDDYRLSLTQGSFVTLSNLDDLDFERILRLHLSPLYISVHAWDPQVRVRMMKNPKAGDLPKQLIRLADAGITMHAQIVLVPGYNDGAVLKETVERLAGFFPAIQSIAVVPVGLTKFREELTSLRGFTQEEARSILRQGELWQHHFFVKTGRHLVYFSDEFYALAGWDYPQTDVYDEFPQLENGVGMASKFVAEMKSVWPVLPKRIEKRHYYLITGVSAEPFFRQWAEQLRQRIAGLTLTVRAICNDFFGPTVTVAGLLTAEDIANQLGNLQGSEFLIPRVMLKADEDIFLDDREVTWLEEKIQGKAKIVENNGVEFLEKLIDQKLEVDTFE